MHKPHLLRRKAVYYFRAKVPQRLRDAFGGKAEVKYFLKTKDFAQAKRLARKASVEFDRQCAAMDAAQAGRANTRKVVVDENSTRELCDLWRHLALSGDEQQTRAEGLSDDEFEEQTSAREETQQILRAALARGQTERIEPALQQFLYLLNIELVGDGESRRRLAYAFLQATADALPSSRRAFCAMSSRCA